MGKHKSHKRLTYSHIVFLKINNRTITDEKQITYILAEAFEEVGKVINYSLQLHMDP